MILALLLLISSAAQAAPTERLAETSSRFDWLRSSLDRVDLAYDALFLGPRLHKINGDLNGKGTNVQLRNTLSLAVEAVKNWEVAAAWEVRRYWRPVNIKKPKPVYESFDPTVTLTRKKIIRGNVFRLDSTVSYAIPVSKSTKASIGDAEDIGRGVAGLGLKPSLSFLDDDLSFTFMTEAFYNIDKNAEANREAWTVKSKPIVSYQLHRRVATELQYKTGSLRRNNNGKWSKFNDPSTGHKVFAGIVYAPTAALSLNPTLAWGDGATFRLKRAEVAFAATYAFL